MPSNSPKLQKVQNTVLNMNQNYTNRHRKEPAREQRLKSEKRPLAEKAGTQIRICIGTSMLLGLVTSAHQYS